MENKAIITAACACLLYITVSNASASVIYTYMGSPFDTFTTPSSYDSSMSVNATIELDFALELNTNNQFVTPLSFIVTDGINTITQENATSAFFRFDTDELGNILAWQYTVSLFTFIDPQIVFEITIGSSIVRTAEVNIVEFAGQQIIFVPTDERILDYASATRPIEVVWEVVPIPATIWLFGSGLLGLIGVARRKARS